MSDPTPPEQTSIPVGRAFLHRELVFVLLLSACGVLAFVAIRALAASNAAARRSDATTLYARGRDRLSAGDTAAALAALRRAARIDPANRDVSFALASALSDAGNADDAVQVLVSLRDAEPDDAEANAALARLELARGNLSQAARYYQDALDVLWMPEAAARSRTIRTEFIHALLAQGQRGRALAQTLILAASLPPDPPEQISVGQLFLQAGDPQRALGRFTAALTDNPHDSAALAGAGEAAFELGDYTRALRDLTASDSADPRVAEMRQIANLVLTGDPLAPRLGRAARAQRVDSMLAHASARLDGCGPSAAETDRVRSDLRSELASLAEGPATRNRAPEDDRDRAEAAVELAVRVEDATQGCGTADALSRAVPLIARAHGLEARR